MNITGRKVKSVRMHVSPGVGGVNGTSVNDSNASITLVEGGVHVSNNVGDILIPFSNIVGVVLEKTEPKPSKDAGKSSSKD